MNYTKGRERPITCSRQFNLERLLVNEGVCLFWCSCSGSLPPGVPGGSWRPTLNNQQQQNNPTSVSITNKFLKFDTRHTDVKHSRSTAAHKYSCPWFTFHIIWPIQFRHFVRASEKSYNNKVREWKTEKINQLWKSEISVLFWRSGVRVKH